MAGRQAGLHMLLKRQFLPNIKMKKGFSLLELLVGFALVGILMSTGVVLLFTSLRSSKKASAVGTAKAEGAYALNTISQKVRYAQGITCDLSSPVKLTVNLIDNSYNVYSLNGGQLQVVTTAADGTTTPTINLTSNRVTVSACAGLFTCDGTNSSVSICFNINLAGDVNEAGSASFQSQVSLRNNGN